MSCNNENLVNISGQPTGLFSKGRNKAMYKVLSISAIVLGVLHISHNITNIFTKDVIGITGTQGDAISTSLSVDYKVDSKCNNLATIKPSGSFFLDHKVHNVTSLEKISPSFNIGSYIGPKVKYHMSDDTASFDLIKELLKGKEGGLTFDMGANQGFYTYYLAALGMQVHSFEISDKNFVALQHGTEFNLKPIADRVNLYPFGLGEKNARFGMKGADYEGFLTEGEGGNILGVNFDCFAHHSKLDLSDVAFIKVDVEGFEIGVLKGAHNSLFHKSTSIGGMLMEVGPKRWGRAQVDLLTGTTEMKKLASHFKKSYLLTRVTGSYVQSCPSKLGKKILSDKVPTKFKGIDIYEVHDDEWDPLMAEMEKAGMDCNFWYTNKQDMMIL